MKNKIINYLMENFGPDEYNLQDVQQFIDEQCDTDDILEFCNLALYFENANEKFMQYLFDKIANI